MKFTAPFLLYSLVIASTCYATGPERNSSAPLLPALAAGVFAVEATGPLLLHNRLALPRRHNNPLLRVAPAVLALTVACSTRLQGLFAPVAIPFLAAGAANSLLRRTLLFQCIGRFNEPAAHIAAATTFVGSAFLTRYLSRSST